jgi:gliding motility-associated-like protein
MKINFLKILFVFFSLIGLQFFSFAGDLFWINGSGDWNDADHWSFSSGGISAGQIPSAEDVVHFDENSFSTDNSIITFGENIVIAGLISNSHYKSTLISESSNITITEKFQLSKPMEFSSSGTLNFSSELADFISIETANIEFRIDVNFSGNWKLANHLKASDYNTIRFNSGTFKSEGFTVHANNILANEELVKLNFTGSNISVFSLVDFSSAENIGGSAIYHVLSPDVHLEDIDHFTRGDDDTRDATVLCDTPPFELELLITSDYNGRDVSCFGECDASIEVIASGSPGPFSYRFGPAPAPFLDINSWDDLCVGPVSIFVLDSSNEIIPGLFELCRVDDVILGPFELSFDPPVTVAPSCDDVCDGQAFADPSGGTDPITIDWPVSGETGSLAIALCAGWNPVIIEDINGCTVSDSVFINDPEPIIADPVITPLICNGDCDAEIVLSPSGGNGGPYTINWDPAPASGVDTNPGIGFCAGDITLTITDNDGCDFDTTITIDDPDPILVDVIDIVSASCPGVCDGEATATAAGGIGVYSYEWFNDDTGLSTGVTTSTITGLCAGNYFVIVTDENGCTTTSAVFTINEPLAVTAVATSTDISCFGICDGTASVIAGGGTPPYTYSWTTFPAGVGVGATPTISGLCPGDYQIIIEDANGCFSTPVVVSVTAPDEIIITLDGTDPTCFDECNGEILATVIGGTPPYDYAWSPTPPTGDGTDNPTDLCPGEYTLTITDDNGCVNTATIELAEPLEYEIEAIVDDLDCFGDVDGTIDITIISGGLGGPYTYTWVPAPPIGDGTGNVGGLTEGTWTVTISDPNACDTTLSFVITEPAELIVDASIISTPDCHDGCNGSAQIVITGGTAPFDILWDDPLGQTTLVASDLCAGVYTATVTDDHGCTASDNVTLIEPDEFVIDVSQTDLDCFGDCNATATVTMLSGGTAPYTYLWDDPLLQTTPTAINLCAGTYTCVVTDNRGCDTTLTFDITEPDELIADILLINSSCFGSCNGAAYLMPTGGTLPYTFEWFDADTDLPVGTDNDSIAGLCPGDYYAIITDGNGCTVNTADITIDELPEIITTIVSTTDATCGVCDGEAEINATGGDGGFVYDWIPDPATGDGTNSVTGLCAGAYTVLVTDASGCEDIITVSIDNIALEEVELDSIDVSCFGLCDGQATASFVELDPPYIIEWFDNATGVSTGQFGLTAIDLCAGEYLAVITNATGCVTTSTIVINEPDEITGTINAFPASCDDACDGSANAVITGGTGVLTYDWGVLLPGSGEGTPSVSGLCPGPWNVLVTDEAGCTKTFNTTIIAPSPVVIDGESSSNTSCFGASDGTATIIASGGTPPYTYEWVDCATFLPIGQTTPIATGLAPGSYQCIVTDANGCDETSTCITIDDAAPITADITIQSISCFGECDGQISVVPGGGVPSYFYQWLNEFGAPIPGQTNDTITNVCSGIYNLEITDLNGCSQFFGPFDLTNPSDPWDVVVSTTNTTCGGDCDGSATVVVLSGNNPPYTYLWDDPLAQVTATANLLCEGTYTVTISDAGVCDTTVTVEVTANDPIFANLTSMTPVNCFGECTGELTVAPIGGTGPYTLIWSDGQTGTNPIDLCAGPITLTITDALGCTSDTTIIMTESPELVVVSSFSNNTTCGLCNGSATVNIAGGNPGYSYDWTPDPISGEGTNNATGLCAGVVSVTVTDDNGCTITEVFPISDVESEDISVVGTDASCFDACDGTATVDYICGDLPCAQEWFDAATGASLGETGTSVTDLCQGEYFVQVTNGSGCISIASITIDSPSEILANEVLTDINCEGDEDGTITLFPSGGSGTGYTYAWTPIPPNGDGTNEALLLGPGIWEVDITDSDGCSQTFEFEIDEPAPITLSSDPTNPTCFGLCNGTITVTASGGAGGYTYEWYQSGVLIPGETSALLAGLCPDNYNVIVTDINGCTQTFPVDITISEPIPITSPITATDVSCFGECDGTATLTISGGEPEYIINWYDGITDGLIGIGDAVATGLCPGVYYAVITDQNGCSFTTDDVTVNEPDELTFIISATDAECFGDCSGTASITVSGGTPDYNYTWLTLAGDPILGGTAPSVTDLCAGNYTIEVVDDNGCSTGEQNVLINSNDEIEGDIFTNDATCGIADGNATIFVTGGVGPYTYQWFDDVMVPIPGETNMTLLDVTSGIYHVTITDAAGCEETFLVTISDLNGPDILVDAVTNPACHGEETGSIEVTVVGDEPPFATIWNPDGIISEDIFSIGAGDYILQVTDNLGCVSFFDTTLVQPNLINSTATIVPTDCGLCNGSIEVTTLGGTGALTVEWNTGATTELIEELCTGVYEVEITDENGCLVSNTYVVEDSEGLTGDLVVTPETCVGSCDGTATVTGIGGVAPYSYLWLHDGSVSDTQTGLCEGSYFVEITDAEGCKSTVEVELNPLNEIDATSTIQNPSCGLADGSISVDTEGGVLPHTYLWSTGDITSAIDGITAGIYILTVTDALGCSKEFTFNVSNTNAPIASLTATDATCPGTCDATIEATDISGGTEPYSYAWYDEAGVDLGMTTPTIIDLCAGTYIIEITDAAGCISYWESTVEESDGITLNPLIENVTSCSDNCDGSLIANPFGGTFPFTYLWDDPGTQTTPDATELCAGTYTVEITDANGCSITQTGTVLAPDAIVISLDSIVDATCPDATDGGIYISITGGSEPFTYNWTDETLTDFYDTEDISAIGPKSYYVTVTDANGCESVDTFTVNSLIEIIADAGADTLICNQTSLVLYGASNIVDEVEYTWYDSLNNEVSNLDSLLFNADLAGETYFILEVSYEGCSDFDTVFITIPEEVVVDAGEGIDMYKDQTEIIGGSPTTTDPNTVVWFPSDYLTDTTAYNPSVVKPEQSTMYYVIATDTNGCSNIDSIFVEVIPNLIIPDGISPNGDGKNDTWILSFIEQYPDVSISINVFNRWGDLLFIADETYQDDWDGTTMEGKRLAAGTYYYVIEVDHEDFPEAMTGPITIMW